MTAVLLALGLLAFDDKAAEDALEKFKADYKSQFARNRATAVVELSKTQHSKILAKLGALLVVDDKLVRMAAATGLGAYTDNKPKSAAHLVNAMGPNDKSSEVLLALFDALGKLREDSTGPAVNRYFKNKDGNVAGAAIDASGFIRSRSSIDPLIDILKDLENRARSGGGLGGKVGGFKLPGGAGAGNNNEDQKEARDLIPSAIKALESITGEKLKNAKDWESWWKANKGTFQVLK